MSGERGKKSAWAPAASFRGGKASRAVLAGDGAPGEDRRGAASPKPY